MLEAIGAAAAAPPSVGIVTVTYGSGAVLDGFLASLDRQTWTSFLVFAIDNASSDNTVARLRLWPDGRLRLLENTVNRGVAAANNQGIRAALEEGCEYVLLLNNDTEFGPDLIANLVVHLRAVGGRIAIPKMFFFDRPNTIWCAGGVFQRWQAMGVRHYGEGCVDSDRFNLSRAVTYAPTCCMLIHRSVFDDLGFMDEKYFVYYDDTDFCLRAGQRGVPIWFCPQAKLWHKVSSLTGALSPFMLRYCTRNKIYFIRKHYRAPARMGWLLVYRARMAVRRVACLDDAGTAALKRAAFREGLSL